MQRLFRRPFWAAALLPLIMLSTAAVAQRITIDGRFSPAQTLVGPNYAIPSTLGKQVGGNLFHSFGAFGLATGESATFSGPASVANIIGRVTGGATSSIDGAVNSGIAGANLYLVNPAGFVFGPHATVNLSGSFHAATADYIRMDDGSRFQATNPDGSTLSAAPPAAFGFLNATPAAITVNGSQLGPVPGTLGLVGGTVSITHAASLSAPAGTIRVTSVAAPGEVPVAPGNGRPSVAGFGAVTITGGSRLDVGDPLGHGSGGKLFVRAGSLGVDASEIAADNFGSGSGGKIGLHADDAVAVTGGSIVHALALGPGSGADVTIATSAGGIVNLDGATIAVGSAGSGTGGVLSLTTGRLSIVNGALLASKTLALGNGGTISLSADTVLIDGTVAGAPTGVLSSSTAPGNASDVTVGAGTVTILSNGVIASTTSNTGNSGNVSVTASGALTIDGTFAQSPTGIATATSAQGNAGTVTVSAGSATVTNNAAIQSGSKSTGNAGNVAVDVAGPLVIDGSGSNPLFLDNASVSRQFETGITSQSGLGSLFSGTSGNAGSVTVHAATLLIRNTGSIESETSGADNGGAVRVTVDGLLTIDGSNQLPIVLPIFSTPQFFTDIASGSITTGSGGDVTVQAGQVLLKNGGSILSGSLLSGSGGNVRVDVAGDLTIDGTSVVGNDAITTRIASGSIGTGNGGAITVNAGSATLRNTGAIEATTFGPGKGGSIVVNVRNQLTIDGSLQPVDPLDVTGIASGGFPGSSGLAGAVLVRAGSLAIATNGEISSSTAGAGNAGSVTVAVANGLAIDGSAANRDTGITTDALIGSSGNAGIVTVSAGGITLSGGAVIASATQGPGAGGNVSVVSPDVLVTGPGSRITAQSASAANAGAISVSGGRMRLVEGGAVSTEARLANGGNIALSIADLLYLLDGEITTSVDGAKGNGGNIAVDPQLVVLNRGTIIANAVGGNGGNITIAAGNYLASADSIVSASSQLGISGTIEIVGPRVDLNGSLAVLTGELRHAEDILRNTCAARHGMPRSSLTQSGRGGLPQDPDATIPALYLAGRNVIPRATAAPSYPAPPRQTAARPTIRCD